jgi:Cdc6-like AAA superfamily ATPase
LAILEYITSWVAKSVPRDTRSNGHDSSNMFWLYGIPGVGKTSVANSLCDRLRRSGNLGGSFFCRRDDPLCEPRRVLPTLISKLVEMWGPFRKQVAKVLYDNPQLNPESTRGEVLLTALKLLTRYPSRTLVLVIDALDECGEPDTRAPLLQCLKEACSHAPWLKIIVTSRPECDITLFFNRHTVTSRDLAVALPASSKSKPLT